MRWLSNLTQFIIGRAKRKQKIQRFQGSSNQFDILSYLPLNFGFN